MVSEERTKLMTKAEIFRVKEERKALKINRFHQSDYVSCKMIYSAISFTAAYFLLVIMWILYNAEPLMTQKSISELADMGIKALIVLACLLACFLVAAFFVFRRSYRKAREKVKRYQAVLKQISRLYEKETVRVWRESEELRDDNAAGFKGTR